MQYLRISSSASVPGQIVSRASMPRISLSQNYPLAASDPAVMIAYRAALAERHLREHLQLARDGTYFSPRGTNLWELTVQCLASEHYLSGEAMVAVIGQVDNVLKAEGQEPLADVLKREALIGLSGVQRAAIHTALVSCAHPLSELTAEEKHMTWLDHPQWLAEDRTIAAELSALLMVRRRNSKQYFQH